MAKNKVKYYVVWVGRETGIFTDWDKCKQQVEHFEGAKYKSFASLQEAQNAFLQQPDSVQMAKSHAQYVKYKDTGAKNQVLSADVIVPSLSVDAACSGNPGVMEYRGVDTQTGQVIFHQGPFSCATNNIGEFLALVHGLAYMKKNGYSYPIYSDSRTAQSWVRQRQCKTKLERCEENQELFRMVERAQHWLQHNTYTTQIIKWNTERWGEIPADFGRK